MLKFLLTIGQVASKKVTPLFFKISSNFLSCPWALKITISPFLKELRLEIAYSSLKSPIFMFFVFHYYTKNELWFN